METDLPASCLFGQTMEFAGSPGNFYLFGGPGVSQLKRGLDYGGNPFYRLGVQIDFETRRVYFATRFTENHLFKGNKKIYNRLDLTMGLAPYLANFDELNSWILLRVRANDTDFRDPVTIVMIRFFYKNFYGRWVRILMATAI